MDELLHGDMRDDSFRAELVEIMRERFVGKIALAFLGLDESLGDTEAILTTDGKLLVGKFAHQVLITGLGDQARPVTELN